MPKSVKTLSERAKGIQRILLRHYISSETALHWENPFQLLVATILSAQCTDKRVNLVTPALFHHFPDAQSLASASLEEIRPLIASINFFNNKTKHLSAMAKTLMKDHGGEVPETMEELLQLAGVARKTANCVLGQAFRKPVGVVVDTHVGRIARRLGLTTAQQPERVEKVLMDLFPKSRWTWLSHALIDHGRAFCTARTAKCEECPLKRACDKQLT